MQVVLYIKKDAPWRMICGNICRSDRRLCLMDGHHIEEYKPINQDQDIPHTPRSGLGQPQAVAPRPFRAAQQYIAGTSNREQVYGNRPVEIRGKTQTCVQCDLKQDTPRIDSDVNKWEFSIVITGLLRLLGPLVARLPTLRAYPPNRVRMSSVVTCAGLSAQPHRFPTVSAADLDRRQVEELTQSRRTQLPSAATLNGPNATVDISDSVYLHDTMSEVFLPTPPLPEPEVNPYFGVFPEIIGAGYAPSAPSSIESQVIDNILWSPIAPPFPAPSLQQGSASLPLNSNDILQEELDLINRLPWDSMISPVDWSLPPLDEIFNDLATAPGFSTEHHAYISETVIDTNIYPQHPDIRSNFSSFTQTLPRLAPCQPVGSLGIASASTFPTRPLQLYQQLPLSSPVTGSVVETSPNPREGRVWKHHCGDCSKTFRRRYLLEDHKRIHRQEETKTYHCKYEGCPRAFSSRSNMKRHFKTHESLNYPNDRIANTPPHTTKGYSSSIPTPKNYRFLPAETP